MEVIKIGKTFWAGFIKALVHFILKKNESDSEISEEPSHDYSYKKFSLYQLMQLSLKITDLDRYI